MEAIHGWILSITAAAMLTALCKVIMPVGTVRRVSDMTCALLLFVVIVRPVVLTDYSALAEDFARYYSSLGGYDPALEAVNAQLTESLIAEHTAAYIQGKAEEKGVACTVTVECENTQGIPVPESMEVSGALNEAEREILLELAEGELGMNPAKVIFTEEDGA